MARAVLLKRCPKCKEWLPLKRFDKNRARENGVDVYCKTCKKSRRPAYNPVKMAQYRDERREELKVYMQKYMSGYRKGERRRKPVKA